MKLSDLQLSKRPPDWWEPQAAEDWRVLIWRRFPLDYQKALVAKRKDSISFKRRRSVTYRRLRKIARKPRLIYQRERRKKVTSYHTGIYTARIRPCDRATRCPKVNLHLTPQDYSAPSAWWMLARKIKEAVQWESH
jgi:hypothetical protein